MLTSMIKNIFLNPDAIFLSRHDGSPYAQSTAPGASTSPASPALETDEPKDLCTPCGLLLGKNLKPFALKPEELAFVKAGLSDAVTDAKPQARYRHLRS